MNTDREEDFDSFYREYFQKIFKYTYCLTGNHEEAEQITQEAFTRLFDYFLSNTHIQSRKALVYRIAGNSCVDYLRRKRKTKEILNQMNTVNNSQDDPEQNILKRKRITLIRNALVKLSPRDQRCLILYQEGLTYSEIAEAIKVKKTSIGKILSRATEKLASQIRKGE